MIGNKNLILTKIDKTIFCLLVAWCFSTFFLKIPPLANVFAPLLFLGLLLYICFDFKTAKETFLANLRSNFVLLSVFAVLFTWAIIISLNSYAEMNPKEFKQLIRHLLFFILLLTLLSWLGKKNLDSQKIIKYCFYALIASFAISLIYFFIQDIIAPESMYKRRQPTSYGVIDRPFSKTAEIYFPFIFAAFFVSKEKYKKIFLALLLFIGLIFLILCGSRGGVVALIATFFFMILCYAFKNGFDKRKLIFTISFVLITAVSFGVVMSQNEYLQKRYNTTHSSGRDLIIKERFPLLLNSKYALTGLGTGSTQYQKFLNDQPEEIQKKLGPRFKSSFPELYKINFFHDEPAVMGIYWHYGILGSIAFIFIICYLFFSSMKAFFKENNYYAFGLASSVFSYFIVTGLVENHTSLKLMVSYGILYLIFKFAKFDKSSV